MTLLDDRGSSTPTVVAPAEHHRAGAQSAKDFYLRSSQQVQQRRLQVLNTIDDGALRWLARYVEDQVNRFLDLRPGWDGYRGRPLSDDALNAAIPLLFQVTGGSAVPPQLFPLADGGLQMEWHAAGEDIEIEVDGAGSAHVLASDASGDILLDEELTLGSQAVERIRALVHRLADRVAGAPISS